MPGSIGLLGLGCAVPPHVRKDSDPIFDRLRERRRGLGGGESLFEGPTERRYLAPGETVEDLMVLAGQRALAAAGVAAADVDRLYGHASVSEYLVPSGLFKVHHGLGLSSGVLVVPVESAFTSFLLCMVLAWEAIAAGHCRHALIDCGSGWTRNCDYQADYALVVGDGAGAAVIGPSERFTLVDYASEAFTADDLYRGMNLGARGASPTPTFEIDERGVRAFLDHGLTSPPRLVRSLLERHRISSDRVAFVGHQGSRALTDHWVREIQPKQYLHTADQYGDLTSASIPVTLATVAGAITAEYLILAAPGPGVHFSAILLRT